MKSNLILVEPYLDLYGLEPYAFRLLAHIARRSQKQECTSSLDKIAFVCRMSSRKAQDSLDKLHQLQLISKKYRYREPSLYRVNQDIELWAKPQREDDIKDPRLKEFITQERRESFLTFQEKRQKESSFEYKVIFIHGYLDLYGLDPYAFRLLAYIASQRVCSDGLGMIAAICKMSSRKVQTTLKHLVQQGLVYKEVEKGKPSTYWLAPLANWQKPLESWKNERALARLETFKDKHGAESEDYKIKLEEYKKKQKKYTSELRQEMARVRDSMHKQELLNLS